MIYLLIKNQFTEINNFVHCHRFTNYKKMNKPLLLLSFIALLTACTATKLIIPSQADADRGAPKFPGISVAELNDGKAIYEQHCQSCHKLKSPKSEDEKEWNRIVPVMVKKTNKKAGKEVVDVKSQEILLKYLITMSTSPVK